MMKPFSGWCIYNRGTGKHITHIPLQADEWGMPGYVQIIERTYWGFSWVPIRRIACIEGIDGLLVELKVKDVED